jgi:hypothetical protein
MKQNSLYIWHTSFLTPPVLNFFKQKKISDFPGAVCPTGAFLHVPFFSTLCHLAETRWKGQITALYGVPVQKHLHCNFRTPPTRCLLTFNVYRVLYSTNITFVTLRAQFLWGRPFKGYCIYTLKQAVFGISQI